MSMWGLYFGWPSGQLWPNLLASAVASAAAVGVAWWRLHRQSARQHVEHLAVVARNHFDLMQQGQAQHRQRLELARRQHQEMKDHVIAAVHAGSTRP